MPARSAGLKKERLRCSGHLEIKAAGGGGFDRFKILIDRRLPAAVHLRVERRGVRLIIHDEKGISAKETGRKEGIGPKPQDTAVFLQHDNRGLPEIVFLEERGIIFAADAEVTEIPLDTFERLLLKQDVVRREEHENREPEIRCLTDDAEELGCFS